MFKFIRIICYDPDSPPAPTHGGPDPLPSSELGLDEHAMLLRALEEKRFLPLGSDGEASSDFQLIAGTNRNLGEAVREARFREDLLARINLWTFHLPALVDRREDIEPNVDYELEQFQRRTGTAVAFSKEAREQFLAFATSADARWPGNFRDLNTHGRRLPRSIRTGAVGRCPDGVSCGSHALRRRPDAPP